MEAQNETQQTQEEITQPEVSIDPKMQPAAIDPKMNDLQMINVKDYVPVDPDMIPFNDLQMTPQNYRVKMGTYHTTVSQDLINANNIKCLLLEALEQEGLLKETAENIGKKYIITTREKGWFGYIYDKFFGISDDAMKHPAPKTTNQGEKHENSRSPAAKKALGTKSRPTKNNKTPERRLG
jgi:hypothetical protein